MSNRIAVAATLVLMAACSPKSRAPLEIKAPNSPEAVARGRYLATAVANCIDCHSDRDFKASGGPVAAGNEFAGGLKWDPSFEHGDSKFPGTLQASNLTQDKETGLGDWSDGEILRAMREGVNKKGKALFPIMPYQSFQKMTDDDALAVIAYLRTLPAKKRQVAERSLKFPMNFIVNTIPKPMAENERVASPATDPVSRGHYLVNLAGCVGCHTVDKDHEPDPTQLFAGGVWMASPTHGLAAFTSNITPDKETGLGAITEAQFITMMREGKSKDNRPLSPIMPWNFYRNMTDDDLKAIFAYLMTAKPIKRDVLALYATKKAN